MLESHGAHLPVVLLDQDGPLAQWEPAMNHALLEIDPDFPVVHPDEWNEFYFYQSLPEHAETLRRAYRKPGFYRYLEPVPGSIEAVREMSEYVNVIVATRPMFENEFCESDKKWWLRKHHGDVIARRSNYVYDKTLLRGKFIVEDHPSPAANGLVAPEWTQIVFDKPYNKDTPGLRILSDWSNWKQVFSEAGLIP
jgi:5'(3')-deoxyribonucleotidase